MTAAVVIDTEFEDAISSFMSRFSLSARFCI
jgi:hypothetical protein